MKPPLFSLLLALLCFGFTGCATVKARRTTAAVSATVKTPQRTAAYAKIDRATLHRIERLLQALASSEPAFRRRVAIQEEHVTPHVLYLQLAGLRTLLHVTRTVTIWHEGMPIGEDLSYHWNPETRCLTRAAIPPHVKEPLAIILERHIENSSCPSDFIDVGDLTRGMFEFCVDPAKDRVTYVCIPFGLLAPTVKE